MRAATIDALTGLDAVQVGEWPKPACAPSSRAVRYPRTGAQNAKVFGPAAMPLVGYFAGEAAALPWVI
jgi:hypothetical protein